MAKTGEIQELFSGSMPANYTVINSSIVSSRLQMSTSGSLGYFLYNPVTDLNDSYASVEVVTPGDYNGQTAYNAGLEVDDFSFGYVTVRFTIDYPGTLRAEYYNEAGAYVNPQSTVYNPTTHRWLRIRIAGTTIYWDCSANGRTWTNFYSVAKSTFPNTTWLNTQHGVFAEATTSGTNVIMDNLNHYYHDLVVQETSHTHGSETPSLLQDYKNVPTETLHAHTVDNTILTQKHVLGLQDASHGHSSDNTVVAHNILSRELYADVIEITILSPKAYAQDSTHSLTSDNISLTQKQTLQVQNSVHGHYAEQPQPVITNILISDALQVFSSDNITLTQKHYLTTQQTFHNHWAGIAYIILSFPGAGIDTGRYGKIRVIEDGEVGLGEVGSGRYDKVRESQDGEYAEVSIPTGSFPEG